MRIPGLPACAGDSDGDGIGDESDAEFNCAGTPAAGCLSAGKSVLLIRDTRPAGASSRDALVWTWANGPAVDQSDFGDPTTSASYALCVYAGAKLAVEVNVAAGGKWSATGSTGYKFSDPTGRQDGTRSIKARRGAAGKARLLYVGKGANLPLRPDLLPLDGSGGVMVQMRNSESDTCWEAGFAAASVRKNTAKLVKAKLP